MPFSPAAALWRAAATAASPLLPLWLARRARRGKEDPARLDERCGKGADRPPGNLLWMHGASVGESQSLLPLMTALAARRPALRFLVTTGTVTAARLLAERLPPALAARTAHRYAPLDIPAHAARFLDGWRPDAAVFVESELWPNLLRAAARRGVPMALVNARLSARSARAWTWAPGLARRLLGGFRLVVAQTEEDAARLRALGADAQAWGNLKFAADPLPADPAALAALRAAVAGRPVLLAASTHPGEESQVAAAHALLRARLPDLLTIIAPRHPERGPAIVAGLAALPALHDAADASPALPRDGALVSAAPNDRNGGVALTPGAAVPPDCGGCTTKPAEEGTIARRAAGALPDPGTAIYVADTLGELGLLYRLAGVALVGGSLVPHGGQNPLEPARLHCPILLGPHTGNFAAIADRLIAAGGAARVADAAALADAAADVLSSPGRARSMTGAAARIAADSGALPDRLAAAIEILLGPARVV